MEFIAKLLVGTGEEPTKDKPIVESVTRNGRMEVATKKVADFNHEEKVKKLAEQSRLIMEQAGPILEKMRKEMEAQQPKPEVTNG